MAVDSTFEFEKRRNRPVKYDRNMMGQTIQAIQKVGTIQEARKDRHFADRMKEAYKEKKAQKRTEIEKSINLLAPAVADREKVMRNVVDSARARIAAKNRVKGAKQLASGGESNDMDI